MFLFFVENLKEMKSSKKLVKIALKKIKDKVMHKGISGVPSGFVEIDEFDKKERKMLNFVF